MGRTIKERRREEKGEHVRGDGCREGNGGEIFATEEICENVARRAFKMIACA